MSVVFLTDRDLGTRFPEILRSAGVSVERHADHFPPDCPDETWLAEVGRRGWVAVSHNRRIRYMSNERAAIVRARVALLVVIGKAPFPELARSFVATRARKALFEPLAPRSRSLSHPLVNFAEPAAPAAHQRETMRYATVIPTLAFLAMAGCGRDATGPDEPFPAVAGQWEVQATFDGLPASLAFMQGAIQITQATRSAPALGGTWTFTATVGADVISGSGIVFQGSITTTGDITLVLTEPGDPSTRWTLTGRVTGTTAAGRHTLSDGTDSFSGNWTGQRVASITAQLSALDAGTTTLLEAVESLVRKGAGGTYRRR